MLRFPALPSSHTWLVALALNAYLCEVEVSQPAASTPNERSVSDETQQKEGQPSASLPR